MDIKKQLSGEGEVDVEKLKKEIEEAKNKAEEYFNGWKRAQADYINREKEIIKEKETWVKFANSGLVLQFLPIFDHLKQALNHLPEEGKISQWIKGIEQIKNLFGLLLKKLGVEEIKTIGEKFDLQKHEVVGKEKSEENKKGVIIKEIQPGYTMHGETVRPAKIIIGE